MGGVIRLFWSVGTERDSTPGRCRGSRSHRAVTYITKIGAHGFITGLGNVDRRWVS